MNTTEILKSLCAAQSAAGVDNAKTLAAGLLKKYTGNVRVVNGSVIGMIESKNTGHTVMIDAHIDEIALIVTAVMDGGFVKVAAVGGIDLRTVGAQRVTIWGREPVPGVFCSTPPHLKKDEDKKLDISEMLIDVCTEDIGSLISPGDTVTIDYAPCELINGNVNAKAIDDRGGVAALLYAIDQLGGEKPPVNIAVVFSDREEVNGSGAKTTAYGIDPDEAIIVDAGFGIQPGVEENDGCYPGKGTMLGYSPVLSRTMFDRLKKIAEEENIPYQYDIMGGRTGTNADHISLTKSGVPCALLSLPVRSMHTTAETVNVKDIEATGRLIAGYLRRAGGFND